jgi:hypothetical protein
MFPNLSDWKDRVVSTKLEKILKGTENLLVEEALEETNVIVTAEKDEEQTGLTFSLKVGTINNKSFGFADMSHRAQLVMGYYDYDFKAHYNDKVVEHPVSPSAPLAHFGNLLYLVSNSGNVIHSSNCQNPSVIYRIQQPFMPNAPILQKPLKEERDEVIADATSLRQISLTLTDRWLNPVKIKCPLIVTIKMQPIKEDVPTYG